MAIGTGSWYLVTAKSEQLIAAIKDECIFSELLAMTANDVSYAAIEACLHSSLERQRRRA